MTEPAVQVDDLLIRSAAGTILDETALAVDRGERVGLIGESGSGKSTLSLTLLGSIAPGLELVAGNVKVLGVSVVADGRLASPGTLRGLRRRVARLDQDPAGALTPTRRIGYLMTELSRGSGEETQRLRDEALEVFGLPTTRDFLHRFPAELSGGQRRRVAPARALARRPELLVLAEVTSRPGRDHPRRHLRGPGRGQETHPHAGDHPRPGGDRPLRPGGQARSRLSWIRIARRPVTPATSMAP